MIEFGRCNMAYEFSPLSVLIHPERDKMSGSHAVVHTAGEKRKKKIGKDPKTFDTPRPPPPSSRLPFPPLCSRNIINCVVNGAAVNITLY